MKRTLTIVLLVLSFNSYSMTLQQAKKIYRNLLKANGYPTTATLVEIRDLNPNAEATIFYTGITTGALSSFKNDDEAAVFLGHELAHRRLGHTLISVKGMEVAADKLGAVFASKAGYNTCHGMQWFKRYPDNGDSEHPPSKIRYHNICK